MPVLVVGPPHAGVEVMTAFLGALGMASCTPTQQSVLSDIATEALRALGGRADCPPMLTANHPTTLAPFVERVSVLLSEAFRDRHYVIGVDAGTLVTTLWRRALPGSVAVVVMVRDPEDVAQAAVVRDGLSVPIALAVWHQNSVSTLRELTEAPVIVVGYQEFAEDPLSVGADVADTLGAWGFLDPSSSVADAVEASAVRADSHRVPLVTETAKVRRAPRRLYKQMAALAGASSSFAPGKLESAPWWMTTLLDERRSSLAHEREAEAQCQQAIDVVREALVRANQDRTSVLMEHAFVVGERDTASDQRDALRAALEALELEHADALGDLADVRTRLVAVQERYERLQRLQAFARMRWWARFVRELRD